MALLKAKKIKKEVEKNDKVKEQLNLISEVTANLYSSF